jgi:hypothetical protein
MTTSNEMSLHCEGHFNIKHNVASNLLKANKLIHFTFPYLLWGVSIMSCPCNLNFGHFFINCPFPKVCVCESIHFQCFFNRFGSHIPKLCVTFQYSNLTLDMILFLHQMTCGTHHLKACSSTSRFVTAYSAPSTGLDAFKSANFSQLTKPSRH